MRPDPDQIVRSAARAIIVLAVTAMAVASSPAAQENVLGPPVPLQYPFEAAADAPRGVPVLLLRDQIERAADLALCQILMTRAGRPIPATFDTAACEPAFAQRVRDGEGVVHWASGARPLQCGEDCVGRPFLTQTEFVTRPNLRRVGLRGTLRFVLDGPGPIDRDLTYGDDVDMTCMAENGARTGTFAVTVDVHDPVVGDPGLFESVLDFFGSGNVSALVEARINQELTSVGVVSQALGPCQSVGVFRGDSPNEAFTSDGALYDPAPTGSGRVAGRGPVAEAVSSRDRATVHFLRIIRKPFPPTGGAGQPTPGSLEEGQFEVFLNGVRVVLPPPSPTATGGIELPPESGVVELGYCRTVDVTDFDRLQVLFVNGLGGAVWSQIGRAEDFGVDIAHRMTTGRTVLVPGSPGPPNPITGVPTQSKPQSLTVREFELAYAVTFAPRADTAAPPRRASSDRPMGPIRGRGRLAPPAQENAPIAAVDEPRPAPGACRQI